MEMLKTKIVIVDSDIAAKNTLTTYFSDKGYDVGSYADAITALEECSPATDNWDILVVDQKMSIMPASQLISEVRKKRPELPIILMVDHNELDASIKESCSGTCEVVVKPIQPVQLHIDVERVLHQIKINPKAKKTFKQGDFLIGESAKITSTMQLAKKVASSNVSVFITGESGSGKEVIARYIHAESPRAKGPFVAINCSAIPENLLESELFGHAKGAFTGAIDKKIGLFEEAEDGTLFLDEIGDLTQGLQAKLLRVLQEKKIKRIGENEYRPINARIISATHKNLVKEVEQNRFREDLFFRLNVVPINIPSLRERSEDILPLAEYFLDKYTQLNNLAYKNFSEEAKSYLIENPWKGNVRELENAIERAVVMCRSQQVDLKDFLVVEPELSNETRYMVDAAEVDIETSSDMFRVKIQKNLLPLQYVVRKYIEFAVNRNGGAKDRTAKEIGIDRKTLYRKMKNFEQYVQ